MHGTVKTVPISIHALRGEGDSKLFKPSTLLCISIHALRGEGDPFIYDYQIKGMLFLSTPSVGRATGCQRAETDRLAISIHALRGEGDAKEIKHPRNRLYFYPRPPWGGRQQKYTKILCSFCAKGTIVSPPGDAIRRAAAKQPLQHSTTWRQNVETLSAKHPGRCWSPGVRTGVTAAEPRPAQIRDAAQRVRRGSYNGCPAGKTAGCRRRGRSVPSAAP